MVKKMEGTGSFAKKRQSASTRLHDFKKKLSATLMFAQECMF